MMLQKYLFQVSKKCFTRHCVYPSNLKQSYCALRYKYSTTAKERRFTDRHEWVVVENNIGTIGISNYAQESLGDVVFAQLPDPETEFKEGDECGALESVKAASEIYSPVSGTVTEKNVEVEKKPGLINSSCYDKGWLFKLKLSQPDQLKNLMSEDEYKKFLETDPEKDH